MIKTFRFGAVVNIILRLRKEFGLLRALESQPQRYLKKNNGNKIRTFQISSKEFLKNLEIFNKSIFNYFFHTNNLLVFVIPTIFVIFVGKKKESVSEAL